MHRFQTGILVGRSDSHDTDDSNDILTFHSRTNIFIDLCSSVSSPVMMTQYIILHSMMIYDMGTAFYT
jgi:hypothetical protein